MICIYFIFSMKDGCIQHAHRQIKEVEWLQKLCQSDCQNHIGRPGVLCVQMESESEICLLIGVKRAWCDETTAENSWLAWLWPHLHVSHKRLALIIYFFFFFFLPCFSFVDVQHSCTMPSLGHQLHLLPWPCPWVHGGSSWRVNRQESCCHCLLLLVLGRACREANRERDITFPCSGVVVGEHKASRSQAVSPCSWAFPGTWILTGFCVEMCVCAQEIHPTSLGEISLSGIKPWSSNKVTYLLARRSGFFCYTVVNSEQLIT